MGLGVLLFILLGFFCLLLMDCWQFLCWTICDFARELIVFSDYLDTYGTWVPIVCCLLLARGLWFVWCFDVSFDSLFVFVYLSWVA